MLVSRVPQRTRPTRGFTLVELLVAVGLATILISTVVLIFYGSTDIFKISEARMAVFGNARAALDIFARDLQSCLPIEGGQQRFLITNGGQVGYGLPLAFDSTAALQARDSIQFRAIIPVNTDAAGAALVAPPNAVAPPVLRTVHVSYSLQEDSDPELLAQSVGATGLTTTVRTARVIYVMQKRVYNPTIGGNGVINPLPFTTPQPPPALPETERADLCHYVLSMNLEYIYYTGPGATQQPIRAFAPDVPGLILSPFFNGVGVPLGSLPNSDPRLPLGVRLSLRVTEGASERQERLIVRTVWIPLS